MQYRQEDLAWPACWMFQLAVRDADTWAGHLAALEMHVHMSLIVSAACIRHRRVSCSCRAQSLLEDPVAAAGLMRGSRSGCRRPQARPVAASSTSTKGHGAWVRSKMLFTGAATQEQDHQPRGSREACCSPAIQPLHCSGRYLQRRMGDCGLVKRDPMPTINLTTALR